MSSFLTPHELGELKTLQAYIVLFGLAATGGWTTAVLKFCSENVSANSKTTIFAYARTRLKRTVMIAIFLMLLLTTCGATIQTPDTRLLLFLYALSLPFTATNELHSFYMQAQKRLKALAAIQTTSKLASLIAVAAGTKLWGVPGFISLFVASQAATTTLFLAKTEPSPTHAAKPNNTPALHTYARYALIANAIALGGLFSDMLILDYFNISRETTGIYALASLFVLGGSAITYTVMGMTTPYFSEHSKDYVWLKRTIPRAQLLMTATSFIVAAACYCAAAIIIPRFYDLRYSAAMPYLTILLTKYIIWSSQAVLTTALQGLGFTKFCMIISSASTFLSVLVSIVNIRSQGAMSVAYGQTAGALAALITAIILTAVSLAPLKHRNTILQQNKCAS